MIFRMMFSHPSIRTGRIAPCACAAALALARWLQATPVRKATMQGVPNAMQGFSQNRDQPIQIEAASLEMRDKKKEATFAGNVKVVQGDTTMTSKTLVVFYDSTPAPAAAPAANSKSAKSAPIQSARPVPAAVRRSAGWRREAAWS
jgi:lipopolysaccharide export system protein LptA